MTESSGGPWGAVIDALGLVPDARAERPGRTEVAFSGRIGAVAVVVAFDLTTGQVRACAHPAEQEPNRESRFRLVPRASLGGYRGGPRTGDRVFDSTVAIIAEDDGSLVRLGPISRVLAGDLVGRQCAWTQGSTVHLEAAVTSAIADVEAARALLDAAAALADRLKVPTAEGLIQNALTEPIPPLRLRTMTALMPALADAGGGARRRLISEVNRVRPQHGPELLAELTPADQDELAMWIDALDGYESPSAELARLTLLDPGDGLPIDEHPQAQRLARAAMALVGQSEHESALQRVVDTAARHPALAFALGRAAEARRPAGVGRWLRRVHTGHPRARVAIGRALARVEPDAAQALLVDFEPVDPIARDELIEVLAELATPAADMALLRWSVSGTACAGLAGGRVADRVVRSLSTGVRDRTLVDAVLNRPLVPTVRARLLGALVSHRPPGAAALIAALPVAEDEAEILEALGQLGDPSAEQRAIDALGHAKLRRMALVTLGEIGGGHAQAALEARLADAEPEERAQVGQALVAIRARMSGSSTHVEPLDSGPTLDALPQPDGVGGGAQRDGSTAGSMNDSVGDTVS